MKPEGSIERLATEQAAPSGSEGRKALDGSEQVIRLTAVGGKVM
jgi:hypothetical protein